VLPSDPGNLPPPPYVDVDNDRKVTLLDLIGLVDTLRSSLISGTGEGESSSSRGDRNATFGLSIAAHDAAFAHRCDWLAHDKYRR
jgi:hypothetical protein